jgi:transposase, IS5 family
LHSNASRPGSFPFEQMERLEASIRAKVEHPFRVIKNLFRRKNVWRKCLVRSRAQLFSLFGQANLNIATR